MTFQPGANLYGVGVGTRPQNIEVPFITNRAPTSTDTLYPIGKRWIYVGNSEWVLLSQSSVGGTLSSNWSQVTSASGDVQTVLGTTNQVTVNTVGSTATVSLPSAITTPGTLTTTGNLTVGAAAGAKINIPTGTNASIGTSAALGTGGPGTVTVNTTAVTASSLIFLTPKTPGGTQGELSIGTITAGTSFVINSSSTTDTSTVQWLIIN